MKKDEKEQRKEPIDEFKAEWQKSAAEAVWRRLVGLQVQIDELRAVLYALHRPEIELRAALDVLAAKVQEIAAQKTEGKKEE